MSDFISFKSDPLYALVKHNVDQMSPLSPEKRARLALILQRGEADASAA